MSGTITSILELERLERDIFRGNAIETTLVRTFGGQVASQSLAAAGRTTEPEFVVHSLHGYFLRPGDPSIPTVYLVDRIRDGHSFVTRRVRAVQDGRAIFTMAASFHHGDEGIEHQDTIPDVPDPLSLPHVTDGGDPEQLWIAREWPQWDLRFVPRDRVEPLGGSAGRQQLWFRSLEELPDDPMFHVCTLAYLSDISLLNTARAAHPPGQLLQLASLDHAMWFLRPFRADDWLLYDQLAPSSAEGRSLTQGRIFDRSGTLVAAVTQEGLTRHLHE
ncbi:acyl-CoA thioesterase II [Rhodococcus rhodnii]|uniref:Acyl-CoA thioesterase 2 n=2 Tax=Rhodococcus rhodnii TaxID=38312 RepID=R7WKQ0_9NOCA|nr:acyl-CoA thioesterase II [Rhodococcus rhodnii]EOM75872.1 acyl-CoA thioesterase II [Rhodococcus rhodnii LMG 5362]TXG91041.1 acyl-CoA thioesterase II [Rhodococcus rhodnii]